MTDSGLSNKSIVVPFLASGVIGAGIALFLAPKSGKDLRKDIGRFASDTGTQMSGAMSEAIEKGRSKFQESKKSIATATAFDEAQGESIARKETFSNLTKQGSSIILPLIAGSITGAVLALLMAPKVGKDLRQDVKRIAQATADQVVSAAGKGKSMATKAIEAGAVRMKRAA